MLLIDILIFYVIVGYTINNIVALVALYGDDEGEVEIDFPNFILTIPAWPYTLYNVIAAIFSKDN